MTNAPQRELRDYISEISEHTDNRAGSPLPMGTQECGVWHVWVKGVASGQLYADRVDGPYEPGQGHRFKLYECHSETA